MSPTSKRGKRAAVVLTALLLLAIIVPPFVNANRFRARLSKSVSGSIGRPVTMGNVKIRLLPLPGFQIENFAIADDPAFSAEPLLRAESVTARLRLTSLWRGRLEIARLSFSYPSLNLVQNAQGQWNIESLLRYASQLQTAPTTKKKPEARPRFPYIEADSGRINFKIVQDKKAHVLVEADFALWLESENQWRMRLEARPTRTDANLGDTGTLRVEASFVRAEKLEQTPMRLLIDLEKSQLGQLTSLLYGRDRGWRGAVTLTAQLEGTPQDFTARASGRIDDFRRYDIASGDSLRITADCTAKSSSVAGNDSDMAQNFFDCKLPVSSGSLRVQGYGSDWLTSPAYLSLKADTIPIASLAQMFRYSKRDVPSDITGDGVLNAYFSSAGSGSTQRKWIGHGSLTNVTLGSTSLAQVLHTDVVRFGFAQVEQSPEGPSSSGLKSRLEKANTARAESPGDFKVDLFSVALGGAKTVSISGVGSKEQFELRLKGDAEISKLFAAARLLGLQSQNNLILPQGTATFDLSLANHWAGFSAPVVTGNAQLHRARVQFAEVAAPVDIVSASLILTPQEISLQKISAALSGTHSQFDGTIASPRVCEEQPCPVRFDVHASEIDFDELNRILNPKFQKTNWLGQRKNTGSQTDSKLFNLDLIGQLTADRVIMKQLVATNVIAHLAKDNGTVNLSSVRADVLGGKYRGNWRAEFGPSGAAYKGDGNIDHASLAQVSALTADSWGTGTVNGEFKVALAGTDASALRDSLTGSSTFVWEGGSIRRFVAPQFPAGLQFTRWTGKVNVNSGAIQWLDSTMDSSAGKYRISGSATLNRELRLNLVGDKHQILVTGTLEHPQITSETTMPSSSESASNQQNGIPKIPLSGLHK
jgi:hypothetical protein